VKKKKRRRKKNYQESESNTRSKATNDTHAFHRQQRMNEANEYGGQTTTSTKQKRPHTHVEGEDVKLGVAHALEQDGQNARQDLLQQITAGFSLRKRQPELARLERNVLIGLRRAGEHELPR
jgi:hypothetical protein